MAAAETWTHGKLLEWTAGYLQDHGCDNARLDAEVLLAEAAGCQRIDLYATFNEEASEECRVAFRELVRRRAEGMPVAYLVGKREFFSLSFRVTPDTLIPRPETEHLVISAIDRIKQMQADGTGDSLRGADVGTGSGVVAICLAKHVADVEFIAIDLCDKALEVARANAERHEVADRITFQAGDLLAAIQDDSLDLVVSNPPYVSQEELRDADREVKDHEPHLALVGGATGTEVILRLVQQAAMKLRVGGWLLMEISPMIETRVREIVAETTVFELSPTIHDLAGHARVIEARKI